MLAEGRKYLRAALREGCDNAEPKSLHEDARHRQARSVMKCSCAELVSRSWNFWLHDAWQLCSEACMLRTESQAELPVLCSLKCKGHDAYRNR